jgi:hypothetical protein
MRTAVGTLDAGLARNRHVHIGRKGAKGGAWITLSPLA